MNEQSIPIDIHLNQLLDWLISRRICPRDWQKNILLVRKNINIAIQDMPACDEIASMLSGSYINYFHCLQIVELLKQTESSTKNIFGMYSSKRMKDWLEILKLYGNENIFLAEAAQLLLRSIMYELPALKRQLIKFKQIQEDCIKKEAEYAKNEVSVRESYASSCQHIGIEGKDLKEELLFLLDDLPEILNGVATSAKDMLSARNYYLNFLTFTLKRDADSFCLPVLKYIMEKGNTTVFEWRTGEPPEVIEVMTPVMPLCTDSGSTEAADDQIDFGDFGAPSESGDDRSCSSPNGDFVHVEKDECRLAEVDQIDFGESGINWDINVKNPAVTVLDSPEGGKVARGTDALSVMENETTHSLFYADLLELEAFLEQRLLESDGSDIFSSNLLQNAPPTLQMWSNDDIQKMLAQVKSVISQLTDTKLKHLCLIKRSNKYVDRLVDSIKRKLNTAERMVECQKAMKVKYQEAIQEQRNLESKINLIVEKTKVLLSQVESDISKRYKNRPVNIMGALSALQLSAC